MGIPKIAPGTPAMREPMSTEPSTTMGWMPTAPCMIRGWRTFITTIQPAPIRIAAGNSTSGLVTRATRIGGAQARNGPKNGMAMSSPAAVEVRGERSRPSTRLVSSAIAK